jgi:4'-phosphopantetheinyl transferase
MSDWFAAIRDLGTDSGVRGGPSGAIRVWRAELDRPDRHAEALASVLSADVRDRAARFRFEIHRRRFIVGRGLLRFLLGRTLGVAPETIAFAYGALGKPWLRHPAGTGLEFNVSHSNDLALFALSWGTTIGVDLEYQRPDWDFSGVARRYFTEQEAGQIEALPHDARRPAFFRGWTRKEAFLKARGDGLWLGLDQFEVSIDPKLPPQLLRTHWDPDEAHRWSIHDLAVDEGFAASLVVAGPRSGPFVVEDVPPINLSNSDIIV